MKAIGIGLASIGVLLAIACGDADNDAPTPKCDASSCPGGGNAGVGGSGAGGANGSGGASGSGGAGASGRGGAGGSSGATGTGGSAGTTSSDGGGRGGSSAGGTSGANGSAGSAVMDAALDRDASRDASGDANGRQCLEPSRIQDSGTCTHSACRRGTTIEISATNTEVWRIGALFWVMTVCDVSANESGQANQYRTLIFKYTEADWARMREGDPVSMHYGTPAAVTGVPCGRLTKTIQNCTP